MAWGPAALWAVVLFLLSAIPETDEVMILPIPDYVAHFALYTVLGATLAWGRDRSEARVAHWAMVLIGALYGLSDEWHQSFVPGRSPEAFDLLADTIGVFAGYLTTNVLLGWSRREIETAG